ncbi:hypothetical protein [Gulosibacter chungangensis]|uniref:Uncharacterized protein n=1 Tax=Gulosibacter chungangensis TaxID=979746 RepID=A0A7J5BBJ7_9MICO|nr:hypothetical protein [Gulosibacter chungangensis]KAB1643512.1 hypothetical protein F8O05_06400 [Gulosibacter chungangensis]
MRILLNCQDRIARLYERFRKEERGDVPGWVLVALMSAGIVILLWTVAGPLLSQVFEDAINRVTANF